MKKRRKGQIIAICLNISGSARVVIFKTNSTMKKLKSLSSFKEDSLSYQQQAFFYGGGGTEEYEESRTATTPSNGCGSDETVVKYRDCMKSTATTYFDCC